MPRVTRARQLLLLAVLAAVAGCATYGPPPPRESQAPRARCLNDPNETGTRPLFFLFCIESP
jgi:predicted small lipoprotein YifL